VGVRETLRTGVLDQGYAAGCVLSPDYPQSNGNSSVDVPFINVSEALRCDRVITTTMRQVRDHGIATALLTRGIWVEAGSNGGQEPAAGRGGPNQLGTKKEESPAVPCLHERAGGVADLIPFSSDRPVPLEPARSSGR
jgi:hypothetical protein